MIPKIILGTIDYFVFINDNVNIVIVMKIKKKIMFKMY